MKVMLYEKLTHHKWLNLFKLHYSDRQNNSRVWLLASRSPTPKAITQQTQSPDAVVIVARHASTGNIVVTREFRVVLADTEYGFPAGLIDPGESIQQAAQRELKEETGLEVTRFFKESPPVYSSAGMTDESIAMVYLECDGTPSNTWNSASESIEVLLVSQSEAGDLCRDPALKFDAKAWLVLSAFAQTGAIC